MRTLLTLTLAAVLALAAAPARAADDDESIYVVQQRTYSKSGKFEITPLFNATLNNKFTYAMGPAFALAYHMRENIALELMGGYNFGYYAGLVYEVYYYENLIPENVDLKQLKWYGAANILWSPLYGKFSIVPGVLADFDFFVSAGLGVADTVEPCLSNQPGCQSLQELGFGLQTPIKGADRMKLAGNFGVGFRLYFDDWIGFRGEMHNVSYGDKVDSQGETTSDIRSIMSAMLGVSFLF